MDEQLSSGSHKPKQTPPSLMTPPRMDHDEPAFSRKLSDTPQKYLPGQKSSTGEDVVYDQNAWVFQMVSTKISKISLTRVQLRSC